MNRGKSKDGRRERDNKCLQTSSSNTERKKGEGERQEEEEAKREEEERRGRAQERGNPMMKGMARERGREECGKRCKICNA